MALNYHQLDCSIEKKIVENKGWINPNKTNDEDAIRRDMSTDKSTILRPA
ncbi:MAG: hypothetical protein PHP22_07775 [Oscillospiraceae bacterium]|nr:hypothetical protein [Oscillospiraceae bacterium]